MLLTILEKINELNENFFLPVDKIIEKIPFDEWFVDAIKDSVHLLPFLFFIFIVIEIIEFKYSNKINSSLKKMSKMNILISSLASIFPQCGFSVMAGSLYSRKIITIGCLIAVFLGTSDECLPILLANPSKAYFVIPVVGIKLCAAIFFGYLIDFAATRFGTKKSDNDNKTNLSSSENEHEMGCCNHSPETTNKRELFLHPIFHTINIFTFILVITLILNYLFEHLSLAQIVIKNTHSIIVCIFSAILGLIPNCAVSIALTMMLIKGHITFGAAMSGLLANSGLGLLVLLKNNDFKDTLKIIGILLLISIFTGVLIDFILKLI